MNKMTLQLIIIGASLALAAQSNAASATTWDIVGNWKIGYVVEDDNSSFSFTVLSENFQTGTFSAWDNNYNQAFSGTLSGSNINFTDYQTVNNGFGPFLNVFSIEGSIAADGTMSGPMDQANGGTDWTGSFGTESGQATQLAAPSFTTQPVSQVISAGQAVTFTSLATGYPPPTYQWQFDGTNICNATNSIYNLPSTSITNLGLYDVVASNAVGTNMSAQVSLSFLNMQCFPGLVLYGPAGVNYNIEAASIIGATTNWTTVTNVTLTSVQPFILIDYGVITNSSMFYQAVPSQ